MKSKTLGKEMLTNKGGRQMKFKRIIALIICNVLMFGIYGQVFAYDYYNNNSSYHYTVDDYVKTSMGNKFDILSSYDKPIAKRYEVIKHCMAFYYSSTNTSIDTGTSYYNYNDYQFPNKLEQFADYNTFASIFPTADLKMLQQAIQIGLLKGIKENDYIFYLAPSNKISRGEFATLISRLMILTGINVDESCKVNDFNDVPSSHFAYYDIASLVSKGLMNGYSTRAFGVNDTLKSQDALITYHKIFGEDTSIHTTVDFKNVINSVAYFLLAENPSY